MFGFIRRVFFWGLLFLLVWVILQLDFQGRPVKQYVKEFAEAPLIQEIWRQGKGMVTGFFQKDLKVGSEPPMEEVRPEEREALENVLKKESK